MENLSYFFESLDAGQIALAALMVFGICMIVFVLVRTMAQMARNKRKKAARVVPMYENEWEGI